MYSPLIKKQKSKYIKKKLRLNLEVFVYLKTIYFKLFFYCLQISYRWYTTLSNIYISIKKSVKW